MSEATQFKFGLNYLEDDVKKTNVRLSRAISYLHNIKDLTRIFSDFSDGYSAFIFIGKSLERFAIDIHEDDIDMDMFLRNEFVEIIAILLTYLYEIRYELDFNTDIDFDEAEYANDRNEKRIHVLNFLVFICFELEKNSLVFCDRLMDTQTLKVMLNFLNDEKYIKLNENSEDFEGLIDSLVMNVFNLRFTFRTHTQAWRDSNAVNILMKIGKLRESIQFVAHCTVAFIIDEIQIEKLPEMNALIYTLTRQLASCKRDFNENKFSRKWEKNYFNGTYLYYNSHNKDMGNSLYIPMIDLLQCLSKLSVNDNIRDDVYFNNGIKSCLIAFLSKGKL